MDTQQETDQLLLTPSARVKWRVIHRYGGRRETLLQTAFANLTVWQEETLWHFEVSTKGDYLTVTSPRTFEREALAQEAAIECASLSLQNDIELLKAAFVDISIFND